MPVTSSPIDPQRFADIWRQGLQSGLAGYAGTRENAFRNAATEAIAAVDRGRIADARRWLFLCEDVLAAWDEPDHD